MLKNNPNLSVGEVSSRLGKKWSQLPAEQRQVRFDGFVCYLFFSYVYFCICFTVAKNITSNPTCITVYIENTHTARMYYFVILQ